MSHSNLAGTFGQPYCADIALLSHPHMVILLPYMAGGGVYLTLNVKMYVMYAILFRHPLDTVFKDQIYSPKNFACFQWMQSISMTSCQQKIQSNQSMEENNKDNQLDLSNGPICFDNYTIYFSLVFHNATVRMPVYMPDISQHLHAKIANIIAHHTIVHREFWSSAEHQEIETVKLCHCQ